MMASLCPEQRERAGPADEPGAGRRRPGLGDGAAVATTCARCAPDWTGSRSGMRPGGESLGYSDAVEAVAELADLEALEQQLAQDYAGSTLDDVDVELLEQRLGPARPPRPRGAARARARAGAAGLPVPRRRRAPAHPAGRTPARPDRARAGLRHARRASAAVTTTTSGTGPADEPTGLTRPWVFGDELPLDAVAHRRQRARAGAGLALGPAVPARWSRTSRSSRPSGGPPRPSRCASTCRSRWCRTAAGGR